MKNNPHNGRSFSSESKSERLRALLSHFEWILLKNVSLAVPCNQRMNTTIFFAILVFSHFMGLCRAQLFSTTGVDRLGVYANIDQAYHFSDGVFIGGTDRKISIGVTYAQKDGKHVVFLGGGFRLFKVTFTQPELTTAFKDRLNEHYVPVEQAGLDSLVGAAMSQGGHFSGSTGGWLHIGFGWMNPYRPTLNFYYGVRGVPSYGPGYVQYVDPEHQDIEYLTLSTRFYELKAGFSPPFLNKRGWPFSVCINAGFRLTDYRNFSIGDTPITRYTTSDFSKGDRYRACVTLSVSLSFWSNWTWD